MIGMVGGDRAVDQTMDVKTWLPSLDLSCRRAEQEELLDQGQGTEQDVWENLVEMQRINDVFGGTSALTRHLFPRLLLHNDPVTLLDLGTGGAGLPRNIARWARRLRLPMQVLAVDWSGRNLAISQRQAARFQEVQLLQADARSLPVAPGQVDYVISILFLHHLSPEQIVRVFADSYSLANQAVIMSDLIRGWMPYLAFKLIQPIFARNYLTRHDGALSVRRAYTPEELSRLAVRAGLPNPRVFVHWPWRMTLVVEK